MKENEYKEYNTLTKRLLAEGYTADRHPEKRAYIQGYADCIQILYHMGLLKENEGLKWAEKAEVR